MSWARWKSQASSPCCALSVRSTEPGRAEQAADQSARAGAAAVVVAGRALTAAGWAKGSVTEPRRGDPSHPERASDSTSPQHNVMGSRCVADDTDRWRT